MSDLDVIKEIEKIIGKELTPCPNDIDVMNFTGEADTTYLTNNRKQVVGLNLAECQLKNIDFLDKLQNLTKLDIALNEIDDITILKKLNNLESLNLCGNPITDVKVLKYLPNLIWLNLSYTEKLKDIAVLTSLTNLKKLSLGENKLINIEILRSFPNLIELDLSYNQLSDISILKGLPHLAVLNLRENKITDITPLTDLANLTKIDLSWNKIRDITPLNNLKNLKELDLFENELTDITPLEKLKNLIKLDLSCNLIKDINVLKNLPNLVELYLLQNELSNIKSLSYLTNLKTIFLAHNKLRILPEWILDFNLLIKWKWDRERNNTIYLFDNPLEEPPPEVIELGNNAIRSYFDAGERSAINEVKIILIGSGGAGKTSLSKMLRGKLFDRYESQTHGINIDNQQINGINVNFWDFGGHEMQHATHQFFLSKRCLYILVLNSRTEDKEDNAEYWLKYIESFGGNSPILVVLNKIDDNPSFEVNRKSLKEKYQGIQGFYKISCVNQHGLDELKEKLCETFAKVPLIRSKLPKTWFAVKNQLENLSPQKNFIDYQAFRDLCVDQQITDSATQDVLSQYLNDLGVIIHFTDPQLMGTPVLKPRWITQSVYKIINFKPVAEAHGVFNLSDLPIALAKKTDEDFDFPPEKYQHIIELMKKFEICYELEQQQILIPDLLEIQEPDFEFNDEEVLRFRIRYDFLSRLIMPRFIVKRHVDIKNKLRWRTGVVLEDKNLQATAVVKVDYQDKVIDIVVNGNQKRDYFAVIRKTFNEIHSGFDKEKFEVNEVIPLPDYPDYEVEYAELIGYEKARKDDYFVGKLGKTYSVSTLLNGIEKPEDRRKEGDVNYFIEKQEVNMGDKYELQNVDNAGGNIGKKNKIETAESKDESLFKKWQFWLSVFGFIYFCLVLFAAYDLQNGSKLGNKTFERIVLAPIPLLKTDDK